MLHGIASRVGTAEGRRCVAAMPRLVLRFVNMVDLAQLQQPPERRRTDAREGREPGTDGRHEDATGSASASASVRLLLGGPAALAQPAGEPRDLPVIGAPIPGGINYQPAVTPVAARHALAVGTWCTGS